MKNLKLFEDFVDDILKYSDPSKPIERMDLTGSTYDNRNLPQLEIKYAVEFAPSGTFGSISNAQGYLKDMGYTIGSMEGGSPIGFADGDKYGYVSKWSKMDRSEHQTLDGAIIPNPEFREGGSIVLFFTDPKF
jgi:hypothetical protein